MEFQKPHRRKNILTGDWVLVSPQRTQRPWNGMQETILENSLPEHDASCYLCAGNKRAGNVSNDNYKGVHVFENDFPALLNEPIEEFPRIEKDDLLIAVPEQGICKVICYSHLHNKTMALLEVPDIENIIQVWQKEYIQLGNLPYIQSVQIFENKGPIMGCSNPHPHGQIWAQISLPTEITKENTQQFNYFKTHGNTLLSDYLQRELKENIRIVSENEHFICLVPFWATWPYETIIISKKPISSIKEMGVLEIKSLAQLLKIITVKYDNVFETDFPYSMGIHQSPTDNEPHPEWHFHIHFYPPLLRSAQIKKFMVGYEMMGEPQRDMLPEKSAEILRNQSTTHYKIKSENKKMIEK